MRLSDAPNAIFCSQLLAWLTAIGRCSRLMLLSLGCCVVIAGADNQNANEYAVDGVPLPDLVKNRAVFSWVAEGLSNRAVVRWLCCLREVREEAEKRREDRCPHRGRCGPAAGLVRRWKSCFRPKNNKAVRLTVPTGENRVERRRRESRRR